MPSVVEIRDVRVVPVLSSDGKVVGEVALPPVFHTPVRKDLIRRVFLAEFTASLQPKGRDPLAGKRTTAESLGVGYGLARVPRERGSLRARLVNFAVGGRLAHPPRVEKVIVERVNRKERILGTASAVAATASPELVRMRGHVFDAEALPVVIDPKVLETVKKARDARKMLEVLKLYKDVKRAYESIGVRAGKGKVRGRRYVEAKSILFVIDDPEAPLGMAVRNFPGVEVASPETVSVLELAPGGVPGRLTVYTSTALTALQKRFDGKIFFLLRGAEDDLGGKL